MGISFKGACFTAGGIAGIWLVNKILNASKSIVKTVAEERKWHAYYKYAGNSAYSVPPGYARTVVPHEDHDSVYMSPEEQEAEQKKAKEQSEKKVDMTDVVHDICEVAKDCLKDKLGVKDYNNSDEHVEFCTANAEDNKFDKITQIFMGDDRVVEVEETNEEEDEDE